jgi:hypothetical protein
MRVMQGSGRPGLRLELRTVTRHPGRLLPTMTKRATDRAMGVIGIMTTAAYGESVSSAEEVCIRYLLVIGRVLGRETGGVGATKASLEDKGSAEEGK